MQLEKFCWFSWNNLLSLGDLTVLDVSTSDEKRGKKAPNSLPMGKELKLLPNNSKCKKKTHSISLSQSKPTWNEKKNSQLQPIGSHPH